MQYNGFELLPYAGLPDFWDRGTNGSLDNIYNPELGDFPLEPRYSWDQRPCPSKIQYWVINESTIQNELFYPISISVAITAFSYDHIFPDGSMVFYQFELYNQASESIEGLNFGIWMDPDLGCPKDDYVGYDIDRNLVYVYNADKKDGDENGNCQNGASGISGRLPQIAIKQYRGFLSSNFNEHAPSSFVPFQNDDASNSPYALPSTQEGFLNVLQGKWQDGNDITEGGLGIDQAHPKTNYAFSDGSIDSVGWSMCSENFPLGDKSFVMTNSTDIIQPGEAKKMILGVYIRYGDDYTDCPSMDNMIAEMDTVYNFSCPANPFVGTREVSSNTINIYPNPSNGTINFESNSNEKIATVNIYDLSGKLIQTYEGLSHLNNNTLNFTYKGFFLAEIVLENGELVMEKILFQ